MTTPKRILLVEDSPLILAASVHALKTAGYEVAARSSFNDLLESGFEGFDLVLMDVQMPELYGDDVAAVLRHGRGLTTPIYLFSSLPEADLAERAAAARVDGYILKDKGMDHMVSRVGEILGAGASRG